MAQRPLQRMFAIASLVGALACSLAPADAAAQSYPSLSAAAKVDKTGKNDVAVIVAVENYAFLPAVKGAVGNANDWEVFFKKSLGVSNVHVLVDRQATREQVKRFAEMAAIQAKKGGTVWFVFIGHGSPSKDGTDGLLVGVDAQQDPDSLFARGFAQQELLDALNAGKQDQTVVVVDACFSGRDNKGEALAPAQPVIPTQLQPTLAKRTVVLSAAQASEFAGALPGEDRPAFSYLLLGALRGWSATGEVKAQDALGFTQRSLRGIPGRFQQTPGIFGDQDIVLVKGAKEADPGIGDLLRGTRRAPQVVDVTTSEGCDTGKVKNIDTKGKCCWPGQAWSGKACVGIPTSCPSGMVANASAQSCDLPACQTGKVRKKGETQCCWPDQTWATSRAMCVGVPSCPKGMQAQGETCAPTDPAKFYAASCKAGDADGCGQLAELHRTLQAGAGSNAKEAFQLADGACRKGSQVGCATKATLLERGVGVRADAVQAENLYNTACDAGVPAGCAGLGNVAFKKADYSTAKSRFEAACQAGNARGCAGLGILYRDGLGVTANVTEALKRFETSCAGHEPSGCINLGYALQNGTGARVDGARAQTHFEWACTAGDLEGCYAMASQLDQGWGGITVNVNRAASIYRAACDGGHMGSCTQLGVAYRDGRGVAKDASLARMYVTTACNSGHARGCAHLSYLLAEGIGGTRDYVAAAKHRQTACDQNDTWACNWLGVQYQNGQGVGADLSQASRLYQKACDGNEAWGCNNLGVLYRDGRGVTADAQRARNLFTQACDGNIGAGCTNLGYLYETGNGVTTDLSKAAPLYQKGCDNGDLYGCNNMGILHRDGRTVKQDPVAAMRLFRKSCDGGNATGCTHVGYLYDHGLGVTQHLGEALSLYQRACDAGDAYGCNNVAIFYQNGRGVAVDTNRARAAFDLACKAGHPTACQNR